MFCGCELSFGDEPNVHTCPVCLAHPGVLPVPNEEAILYGAEDRRGARLRGRAALDLPPQELLLSRQPEGVPDQPVRHPDLLGRAARRRAHPPRPPRGGRGEDDPRRRVGPHPRLRRLAGRLQPRRHAAGRDRHRARPALGAAEAAAWARLLRETVRQLGVSDVNMEEGSLRVDANVSVRPAGSEALGTKTELKNMNSFRFLERGVEAELARQRELIEAGGDGRTGDPPLRPRRRLADLAALEGGGARLPLLPRARPGAAGADRGDAARGARVAAGAAGGADRALRGDRASPATTATPARRRPRDRRLLRARPPRPRARSSRRSSPTG